MIFSLEIELTDKGLTKWTEVVERVFEYLEMLRGYESLPVYLYEEMKQIGQMSFQFMQEKDRGPVLFFGCDAQIPHPKYSAVNQTYIKIKQIESRKSTETPHVPISGITAGYCHCTWCIRRYLAVGHATLILLREHPKRAFSKTNYLKPPNSLRRFSLLSHYR